MAVTFAGIAPTIAYADTASTPLWTANTGVNSGYSPNILADASGVTVQPNDGALDRPSATLYQCFDRNGVASPTVNFATDYSTSVADAAGDIFEIEYVWSGPSGARTGTAELHLRTLADGIVWRTTITPDFSTLHDAYQLAISDGRVYVLGVGGTEHPVVGTYNAADGSLVAMAQLPAGLSPQVLYPYRGGVFMTDTNGATAAYLGPDGHVAHQYQAPSGVEFTGPVVVNPDGTAYAAYGNSNFDIPGQLIAITPNQGVAWTKPLPDIVSKASSNYLLAVTSDGGVVVGANQAPWPDGIAPALTKFAANGSNTWTEHAPLAGQLDNLVELHGTSNGKFIAGVDHRASCTGCFQIDFGLNDQSTGALLSTVAQLGDLSTTERYDYRTSTLGQPVSLAVENDRLYLTARHTEDANYDQRTVFGFAGSALGTTYPEDVVRATVNPSPSPTPTPTTPSPTPTTHPTPTPTATQPPSCPTAKLFGLRGSGEKWTSFGGFGRTIGSYKDRLATKIPGLAAEPLDYPAIPVDLFHPQYPANYVNSVNAGRDALVAHVRQFITSCPKTYVVFAGYSQGVDAILAAMSVFTSADLKHVAAVDFFGNPSFNPKQVRINIGDFNPKLAGFYFVGPSDNVPAAWIPLTSSYCMAGDPVCNYSARNMAICIPLLLTGQCAHLLYANNGWTRSAADSSAAKWRKMPKLK